MKKVIVLLLVLATVSLAAEDTWTYKADMPTARGFVSGTVVDGKIYVIGGFPTHSSVTQANEMYAPATDTWTPMAGMPVGRTGHATCACDDKIYVFGGVHPDPYASAKNNVYVYDPQTDTWTQKADMPYANAFCGIAVVNDTIYLIGGAPKFFSPPISTVMAYDPVSDSWTQKADMPHDRAYFSACVVDGKIYTFGGSDENISTNTFNFVEVYDPATNSWTSKSNMPIARGALGTCVMNGQIYAVGGVTNGLEVITLNQIYDPVMDAWTTKSPLQQKRISYFLGAVGDKIYAIGGSHPDDQNPNVPVVLNSVEEYDPNPLVVDFNGDGIVDSADMCMMIDYWGTDESLYDIAPRPFGDGIVDIQDLIVLAEHLFEEILPPGLVAYWKLDEAEGNIAQNSTSDNHGILSGNPAWQPDSGQVAGALQFDGIDDYVETDFVLNPADGAFSVFAWIRGGAPGQVIISQADILAGRTFNPGNRWLGVNFSDGKLMTVLGLASAGSPIPPAPFLVSETVITDGQWHHVGFVWDGSYRSLYVDGIEAARDTAAQNPLQSATGGLYIGAGSNIEAGTFFAGLIDDIRVYNKALSAEEIASLAQ
ncbi:MAG TPA: kelch repeat-containing protein [Sedimentisphaerales bacterium]|nr:kelch repeat-containing protein [Sedimentisphaerales bacterium]